MKVIEIAFVGYPVTDLHRARRFYEGTLGLKVSRAFGDEKTGWIEYDIGPGTLSIGNGAPEWKPCTDGASAGLEVESFQDAISVLKADHCKFIIEPTETPVCHLAVVADPDGNPVTIHKRKS
jgi:catechol 2,3-dioxygenase-like lactoylglutathione lyase family enzyme